VKAFMPDSAASGLSQSLSISIGCVGTNRACPEEFPSVGFIAVTRRRRKYAGVRQKNGWFGWTAAEGTPDVRRGLRARSVLFEPAFGCGARSLRGPFGSPSSPLRSWLPAMARSDLRMYGTAQTRHAQHPKLRLMSIASGFDLALLFADACLLMSAFWVMRLPPFPPIERAPASAY
jgi:hypothetical protein